MSSIGIVGAGIGGLHLGILLRKNGVPATVYTANSGDELASGRLLNTVMHHHHTLAREQEWGVRHWNPDDFGWSHRYQYMGTDVATGYSVSAAGPSVAVDYRLYLPTLMKDFEELGGRLINRRVHIDELDEVAARHELLVVATGQGSMQFVFPPRSDIPRTAGVGRNICAALVTGISRPTPEGVTLNCVPGIGELIEIPIVTAQGPAVALLFESVVDGPADTMTGSFTDREMPQLGTEMLRLLRMFYPASFQRVDESSFAIFGPRDVLHGSLSPTMRAGSARLPGGKLAVALGDVHVSLDPVTGQGANMASYSAGVLGRLIVDDPVFDEQFCQRLAVSREPVLRAAYEWTNLALAGPAHLRSLHLAAASDPSVAADLAKLVPDPEAMWRAVATEQRTARYLGGFGSEMLQRHDDEEQ